MRSTWRKVLFLAPLALIGFTAFIALGGVIVRALWNWLLPSLFGWPQITFWQALAVLALCRILFGGFALNGSPRSRIRRRLAERWESMTQEERERIRQGMHSRFGFDPDPGEPGKS